MSIGERYRNFCDEGEKLIDRVLPTAEAYASARAELGPWADDEQVSRRAFEIWRAGEKQ